MSRRRRRRRGLHVDPWAHFPRLITSIDFIKRELPARWDGRARFPERRIEPLPIDYPADERELHLGLAIARQPALGEAALPGLWPDPTGARIRSPIFHLPPLTGSWARCTEGLAHTPHTGKIQPICFDHALVQGRDDLVLVHLNHRLVQMCLVLLRAERWSIETRRRLHRATTRFPRPTCAPSSRSSRSSWTSEPQRPRPSHVQRPPPRRMAQSHQAVRPLLSLAVLLRVFPQGLDTVDAGLRRRVVQAEQPVGLSGSQTWFVLPE